jgi:hypothetical protein
VYVAEYQVIKGDVLVHPLGTEHTVIIRDVKTVAGAIKRLKNHVPPIDAVKCNIYSVTDIQNRETYRLKHVKLV